MNVHEFHTFYAHLNDKKKHKARLRTKGNVTQL